MVRLSTPVLVLAFVLSAAARVAAQDPPDWAKGLDELMTIEVSSVARKSQRLVDTSAAVYVVTRDDIRRSGLTSVPEVLRLVPGLNVAQIDGNKWAISSRGMNARFSNKLVVLIDGRSIYTPFFAGVFWDQIDVPLAAIERIEVIRGPGASIWGANAVNGVINIITTGQTVARETIVSAGVGTNDLVSVVHQGRAGDRVSYRVFGDATAFGRLEAAAGDKAADDWQQRHLGGSMHVTLNSRDSLDAAVRAVTVRATPLQRVVTSLVPYASTLREAPTDGESWSATTRWTRQLSQQGHLQVEAFVDEWQRQELVNLHHYSVDVNLQHRIGVRGRHDAIWGVGYHNSPEHTRGDLTISLSPEQYHHQIANAFVQDDIAWLDGRVHAVLGTKVEHRDNLGWASQPTGRVFVKLTPTQGVWAAASRALRAPDRVERALRLNLGGQSVPGLPPIVGAVVGNPALGAEWLTAYEAGYRSVLFGAATLDVATFYNRYSDLQTLVPLPPSLELTPAPYLLMAYQYQNLTRATTVGGEVLTTYAPLPTLKLTGGYSLLTVTSDVPNSLSNAMSAPGAGDYDLGGAPRHQGQLRASLSLPHRVELDATWFAVGEMNDLGVAAFTRTDARVAWRVRRHLELAVSGQNLFGPAHREFDGAAALVTRASLVRRTAHGGLTWEF